MDDFYNKLNSIPKISLHFVSTYLKEFSGVLVSIIDTNASSKDSDIESNAEISWKHGQAWSVLLEDHLALQEDALRCTAVNLARLTYHDRVVFEVVENNELANSEVLKATLDNAFLEVARKSEDLYNK